MKRKLPKKATVELARLHLDVYVSASSFVFFAATFMLAVFGIVTSIDPQIWTTDISTRSFTEFMTLALLLILGIPYGYNLWKLRRNYIELLER